MMSDYIKSLERIVALLGVGLVITTCMAIMSFIWLVNAPQPISASDTSTTLEVEPTQSSTDNLQPTLRQYQLQTTVSGEFMQYGDGGSR